jgi:hypothetical protein
MKIAASSPKTSSLGMISIGSKCCKPVRTPERNMHMSLCKKGNVQAWKLIQLHRRYNLSRENIGDNLGIAEPKIITIRHIYLPHCKRLTIMTTIQVGCDLTYSVTNPTSFLFNVAAARTAHQTISGETLQLNPLLNMRPVV